MRPTAALLFSMLTLSCSLEEPEVEYTLSSSNVECFDHDDSSSFSTDDSSFFSCIWYCHTYRGRNRQYVDLTFYNGPASDFSWVLDSEFVSTGICN